MAGGILQLLQYSAQDVYLTSNPQITFFKVVYRRYTNFSMQAFEHPLLGAQLGGRASLEIPRVGDLLFDMKLHVVLNQVDVPENEKFAWTRRIGGSLLKSIRIEIGGQIIDTQYPEWIDIWVELSRQGNKERSYRKMSGDDPVLTTFNNATKPQYDLFIPLRFWFDTRVGLAYPIMAVWYHRTIINVEFNNKDLLYITGPTFTNLDAVDILSASLITNYIYLDLPERQKFTEHPHEYLIELTQYNNDESFNVNTKRIRMPFNFPTKEIFWAMKNGIYLTNQKFIYYTNNWDNAIIEFSKELFYNSIILNNSGIPSVPGTWMPAPPNTTTVINGINTTGNYTITNNSITDTLWINIDSVRVNNYVYNDKLTVNLTITINNLLIINNISSTISYRDLTVNYDDMTDTRLIKDYAHVNLPFNFGLYIDGSQNPFSYFKLEMNEYERVEKRPGYFFNYLQPEMYHTNTPKDGVNIYSFCINPEEYQPSGSFNMSKIENVIGTFWINDPNLDNGPPINYINMYNEIYIFAMSYNILRINHGLCALAYNFS